MRCVAVLSATSMLMSLAPELRAGEDYGRDSMRGLAGVNAVVRVTSRSDQFKSMVTSSALLAKVELRLRQAGVRVFTEHQMLEDPRMPTLDISIVATMDDETEMSAIALNVALNQVTWIVKGTTLLRPVSGDTWSRRFVLQYGRDTILKGQLSRDIDETMDEFINAWMATHGK